MRIIIALKQTLAAAIAAVAAVAISLYIELNEVVAGRGRQAGVNMLFI